MNMDYIAEEILQNSIINEHVLLKFGFQKNNEKLIYQKKILNNQYLIVLTYDRVLNASIIDMETNEPFFLPFAVTSKGDFINIIRQEYQNLLMELKEVSQKIGYSSKCHDALEYIEKKYQDKAEFIFKKNPEIFIIRHQENKKWYLVYQIVNLKKFNLDEDKNVETITLKVDIKKRDQLLKKNYIFPAFHMNKKLWISLILEKIDKDLLISLINDSYSMTLKKKIG